MTIHVVVAGVVVFYATALAVVPALALVVLALPRK